MEELSSSSENDNTEVMSIAFDPSVGNSSSTSWDPSNSPDWDNEKPTEQCVARIKRDILYICKEPPPGMFIVPDQETLTKDPFGDRRGKFDYKTLQKRLINISKKLKLKSEEREDDDTDSLSETEEELGSCSTSSNFNS